MCAASRTQTELPEEIQPHFWWGPSALPRASQLGSWVWNSHLEGSLCFRIMGKGRTPRELLGCMKKTEGRERREAERVTRDQKGPLVPSDPGLEGIRGLLLTHDLAALRSKVEVGSGELGWGVGLRLQECGFALGRGQGPKQSLREWGVGCCQQVGWAAGRWAGPLSSSESLGFPVPNPYAGCRWSYARECWHIPGTS